jgi:hypothetical protein
LALDSGKSADKLRNIETAIISRTRAPGTRGHAMSKPQLPHEWKTLYAAAMLETDSTQVPQRIAKADAAIQSRLMELPETSPARSEKAELQSALDYLRRLKASQTTG